MRWRQGGTWFLLVLLAAVSGCHAPGRGDASASAPAVEAPGSLEANDARRLRVLAENFVEAVYSGNREVMSAASAGELRTQILAGKVPSEKEHGYFLERILAVHLTALERDRVEISVLLLGGRAGERSREFSETLSADRMPDGEWRLVAYERNLP